MTKPILVCIGGFGDNSSMFEPLRNTVLSNYFRIQPFNLPGFGAPPLEGRTTLDRLAEALADFVGTIGARIVVAHSVSSIIASIAALRPGSTVDTILSLEGNLTAADAYFSGSAADYESPEAFRLPFLARLDELATGQPAFARYRRIVEKSDSTALWQLGVDTRRFSETNVPGDVLARVSSVVYFYNPDNIPQSSRDWLQRHDLKTVILNNASHWPSIDRPDTLADKIVQCREWFLPRRT